MLNTVNINDLFWTFQGEGLNSGRRALFVRMPFCNLACSWCDTTFDTFKPVTQKEFEEYALSEKARFAVITGGEPSMNKHTPIIITWLKGLGFEIAMESNGTFVAPAGVDHLTVSPKKEQKILPPYYIEQSNLYRVSELKYIVDDNFDFKILDAVKDLKCHKYLSPEFNNMTKNLENIFEYIKENPEWKINLQTHKMMNIK